tara:strand:+ start:303 stop:1625 length:1323 start_codon:yes stop_codon:yes gene_type:complete
MQTSSKQLANGLMFISSWTPPYRVENLNKLFKRVKRVADKRAIVFESEIGKPVKVVVSKRSAGAFRDYAMSKESGTDTFVRYQCPVTLTHGPLTESGWSPLAVLAPMERGVVDTPVIVNNMPDADEGDLLTYVPKTWNGYCDHCETTRRRKQTVLVRSDAGEIRQVGSNCLFEYTGIDPEILVRFYNYYTSIQCKSDQEYSAWGSGWIPSKQYPLYDFLVILGRWLGVNNQYLRGAGRVVFDSYLSEDNTKLISKGRDNRNNPLWIHDLADDSVGESFAEEALNMLQMVEPRNSFDYNLKTVFDTGIVVKKTAGYAGAIWTKWFNLNEKGVLDTAFGRNQPATQETIESHPGEHVGELGERIEFEATVLRIKTTAGGMWGPTTLVTMKDVDENLIITWTTGKVPRSGSKITARGTVKKHGEYQNVKQTQVSRLWFKSLDN